eukprot:CAMPEP_0179911194 /NCGR_PEP_ID=MMETSP0982-20121206/46219_1 /TAXON_ID=483367 /ORGANISM="non described non described, Strain CCMP 2436" /LENGTH=40 /DNA_ID= /DNA_START= /DNA_END= /DNA_ORIENTATION=
MSVRRSMGTTLHAVMTEFAATLTTLIRQGHDIDDEAAAGV